MPVLLQAGFIFDQLKSILFFFKNFLKIFFEDLSDNFKKFLYERYAHRYTPAPKKNTSKNKGFDFYYQNGDIDKGLVNKLMKTDAYKEYYKYGLID